MLNLFTPVAEDALVEALVLLLEGLHAEDGGVGGAVGPGLEAAALHRQVLEALQQRDRQVKALAYSYISRDMSPFIP